MTPTPTHQVVGENWSEVLHSPSRTPVSLSGAATTVARPVSRPSEALARQVPGMPGDELLALYRAATLAGDDEACKVLEGEMLRRMS